MQGGSILRAHLGDGGEGQGGGGLGGFGLQRVVRRMKVREAARSVQICVEMRCGCESSDQTVDRHAFQLPWWGRWPGTRRLWWRRWRRRLGAAE